MSFLSKIEKMPERKKRVFAFTSAVVITLIVVIFALVLNNLINIVDSPEIRKSIFDSGQMKELKDNFVEIFNK
ncbi:MAG: hypothetical protein WC631_01675 [Candidatus Paceibacterota bacterium]|jgi:hypothetical protein